MLNIYIHTPFAENILFYSADLGTREQEGGIWMAKSLGVRLLLLDHDLQPDVFALQWQSGVCPPDSGVRTQTISIAPAAS